MKPQPKYLLIAQNIIDLIQDGSLRSGDQLMTEVQLCKKYAVSRMTVNKALSNLVTKGYLTRTAGKGTFIAEPKVTKYIGKKGNGSFSSDILSIHKKPGAILIDYHVARAADIPNVAELLHLENTDFIHCIQRIRTSDDIRIALSSTYIPCKFLPAIDIAVLEDSLYKYLAQKYRFHPQALDYTFQACLPTAKQKELLQIDACALLKACHRSVLESGELFEYTETYYVGNRYTYRFIPDTNN